MASSTPKNTVTKKKVLIVDDDTDLLELLSDIFVGAGFKVVTATDGVDGSFKYSNETFDIILSDIKMPKKDGIKFVQFVQANEAQKVQRGASQIKPIPIILISASVDDYRMDIELLKNIEVLNKPFGPKEVLEKVARLLESTKPSVNSTGSTVILKTGEYVIREGDEGSDLYFVKEGTLSVFKNGANGKKVCITSIKVGEMIGEMGSFLSSKRTASVVATSDCVLISIPREKLDAVFASQPKWFRVLFETMSVRLEETTRLLAEEKLKS